MSDTDTLTQATKAVAAELAAVAGSVKLAPPMQGVAENVARAALEAAGALSGTAQPNPAPNSEQGCHDRAIELLHTEWGKGPAVNRLGQDLITRREVGRKKYGHLLP